MHEVATLGTHGTGFSKDEEEEGKKRRRMPKKQSAPEGAPPIDADRYM
jgi:hypothetical protein